MDNLTPQKRSKNMAAIGGKDTKPEILVRKYLCSNGVKYRKNVKALPGKPDIAIQKWKLALEVRGCFWHGHQNCKDFRLPKSNSDFWRKKINATVRRDARNQKSLENLGYEVFIVWECQVEKGDWTEVNAFIESYFLKRSIARGSWQRSL